MIGSVELAPDVPIDRLQKITAAVTLATQLNYSPKRVMEFLGETDPQGALREYIQWQFNLAKMQGKIARIEAEESGELEQMAAEMAQQMLADQQAGQARLPAPTTNGTGEGGILEGVIPQGDDLLRQLAFDTRGGGNPAILEEGEGATFEGAEGASREGDILQVGGF